MKPGAGSRWLATVALVITLAAVVASGILSLATARAGSAALLEAFVLAPLVLGVSYGIVGWIVASRRPDNVIGWIFLGIGLSQAFDTAATLAALYGLVVAPGSIPFADLWSWFAIWAWVPGFTMLVTFSLLLFPNGRLPSRRWRPVAWLSIVVMALLAVPVAIGGWAYRGIALTGSMDDLTGTAEAVRSIQFVGLLLIPVVALASVASIILRFRHSTGLERQQLRWFATAAVPEITFLAVFGAFLEPPPAISFAAAFLIAPLLPVAAGIAILRYRLYDLDRLVSRTIAYAVVTGLLAVVFGGSILLLQTVLAPFTERQTIPVAASTLAVFALFQPVMRRVRRRVDRRFDRARYDGERMTAAFAERLRSETNVATVTGDLAGTTRSAVSPTSLHIWLRPRRNDSRTTS